jgi:NAD(P)-dependent dehydrogenase (short-subunit alcohol dehydrogenase family)
MPVLTGKSLVITGAGRGLGAAYARLAAEEGAAVVVNDIDGDVADHVAEDIIAKGGRAIAVTASVAEWDGAATVIDRCVDEFGRIDGLVNNAGIQLLGSPWQAEEHELRRLVEINVLGTMFCGVLALRKMVPQGFGAIVNVTSGAHMGLRSLGAYGATKGAVASLTYCWANDLVGTGVRVNAVSPLAGTRLAEEFQEFLGLPDEERVQRMQRTPTPASNAPTVIYLLSDLAADVAGQIVRVDKGAVSIVGRPAVLSPSATPGPDLEAVADAVKDQLSTRRMPLGLSELTGDYAFTTLKDDA